jgi:hypothetical protein
MSQKAAKCRSILTCSSETGSLERQEGNRQRKSKERQLHNKLKATILVSIRPAKS